jgi:hypothetical protein
LQVQVPLGLHVPANAFIAGFELQVWSCPGVHTACTQVLETQWNPAQAGPQSLSAVQFDGIAPVQSPHAPFTQAQPQPHWLSEVQVVPGMTHWVPEASQPWPWPPGQAMLYCQEGPQLPPLPTVQVSTIPLVQRVEPGLEHGVPPLQTPGKQQATPTPPPHEYSEESPTVPFGQGLGVSATQVPPAAVQVSAQAFSVQATRPLVSQVQVLQPSLEGKVAPAW